MRNFVIILLVAGLAGYMITNSMTPADLVSEVQGWFNQITQSAGKSSAKASSKNEMARFMFPVSRVPKNVTFIARSQGLMGRVFNDGDKVIFYVIDDEKSKEMDAMIKAHMKTLGTSYTVIPYEKYLFKDNLRGQIYNKVCDSVDECKAMKDKASAYSEFSTFFGKCAKTVCIFNNKNGSYIRLKSREATAIKPVLTKYRNW